MSALEISWFSALCDDDYAQLGVPDPQLASSWAHCAAIVTEAERQGFDSVLLPSGYELGLDATTMAAALARVTTRIRLLLAVRIGELWPPQLARQLATLEQIADGRVDVNVISSDRPGETVDGAARYQRTVDVVEAVGSLLRRDGAAMDTAEFTWRVAPPRIATGHVPAIYFGGLSEPARDAAARIADVYLMWPDTEDQVAATIADLHQRGAARGRSLRFGYRVHVVVRETEREARAAAAHLVAALDEPVGDAIRARSLDATSVGVARQGELRAGSDDDGYVEPNLWTGIGRARSGCGAAIVGSVDQVVAKLRRYQAMGIDAFILSGYPHLDECRRVGEWVLPQLDHGPLH